MDMQAWRAETCLKHFDQLLLDVEHKHTHTHTHTHGKCFHLVCWRKTYELSCLSPSHCRCLYCVHLLSDPHTFALQRDVPAAKCEIRRCEVLLFLCYQHPENTGSDVFYKKVHSKQPMPHEHIFLKKKVSGRQG